MKKPALVAFILLAGCAATSTGPGGSDPRRTQSEEKSWIVADREKRCIDKALTRSRDELARIQATRDASADLQRKNEIQERDRELYECHAQADAENTKISAQESNEYNLQAQQARDRALHMMILTASPPH